MIKLASDIRYLRRNLPGLQRMSLQYARAAAPPAGWEVAEQDGLEDELVALIVDLTFIEGRPEIRDPVTFTSRITASKGEMMTRAEEALGLLSQILDRYQRLGKRLSRITQIHWMESVSDMLQQRDQLVFRGFLQHTPWVQLNQFPRYLGAIELRLDKLGHAAQRDRRLMDEMKEIYRQWQDRETKYRRTGRRDPRIEELRWMFEELRVSLFAQELGTAYPISVKRIARRWKELGL